MYNPSMSPDRFLQLVIAEPASSEAAGRFIERWDAHAQSTRSFKERSADRSALLDEALALDPIALANRYRFALVSATGLRTRYLAAFTTESEREPSQRSNNSLCPILHLLPPELDMMASPGPVSPRALFDSLLSLGFAWSARWQLQLGVERDIRLADQIATSLIEARQIALALSAHGSNALPVSARSL